MWWGEPQREGWVQKWGICDTQSKDKKSHIVKTHERCWIYKCGDLINWWHILHSYTSRPKGDKSLAGYVITFLRANTHEKLRELLSSNKIAPKCLKYIKKMVRLHVSPPNPYGKFHKRICKIIIQKPVHQNIHGLTHTIIRTNCLITVKCLLNRQNMWKKSETSRTNLPNPCGGFHKSFTKNHLEIISPKYSWVNTRKIKKVS